MVETEPSISVPSDADSATVTDHPSATETRLPALPHGASFGSAGPGARHRRATQTAEMCWIDGRWSEALLHFLEAEAHLRGARLRHKMAPSHV
ncbi:MAG: hypothetical protein AAGC92_12780 [Pseudomonadota bacterium]